MSRAIEKARRLLRRKSLAIAVAILAAIVAGLAVLTPRLLSEAAAEITYSEFSRELAANGIEKIQVEERGLSVWLAGKKAFVRMPGKLLDAAYIDRIATAGVQIDFTKPGIDPS